MSIPENITAHVFKEMKYGFVKAYSPELLANIPDFEMDNWAAMEGALCIRIVTRALYKSIKEIKTSYPATWWDAFKKRWFPQWAQKRWPVKMHTVVLEARAVYPLMPLPIKNQPAVLHLSLHGWNDDE